MTPNLGAMPINLDKLIESRMLLVASSGNGKSWALRRVLEQTVTHVQQLIIDPEGEFASLREKFDYIICAPRGADAVATPQTAAALATALWKAGTSAVLDLSELKAHERVLFVKRFLETLIGMPREFWHATIVVIDEAHLFCPQTGNAESAQAVIDLATRGRKRGLCLLAATTRIAKVDKDCLAELKNKLIGGMTLDVDVKRAADELGLTPRDAMEKLRALEPGSFFAFGPALTPGVTETRIGGIVTTHPQAGKGRLAAPPQPSAKVMATLAKIQGLQRDAEEEVRTVANLSAELTKLRRELTMAQKAQPAPAQIGHTDAQVQALVAAAVGRERDASQRELAKITVPLAKIRDLVMGALGDGFDAMTRQAPATPKVVQPPASVVDRVATARKPAAAPSSGVSASGQRVLDAIAWWGAAGVDQPTRHQVAFVANYTVNGHFNNQCGSLRGAALIDYPGGGTLALTEAGAAAAHAPDEAPTRDELVTRVGSVLKGEPMRRVFGILAENRKAMARKDLAEAAGYTENGHFNNIVGALNGIGVAEYPTKGFVGLSPIFKDLA